MKYTKEVLEEAVRESLSMAGVLRYLGVIQAGGNHAHISRTVKRFGIDTSHFTGQGWRHGRTFPPRRSPEERLVLLPPGSPRTGGPKLRRALIKLGRAYRCEGCGIGQVWLAEPITLHVDHIDGNYLNNRPANLRFLCPNCHSQTATHAGRNIKRKKMREADQLELSLDRAR